MVLLLVSTCGEFLFENIYNVRKRKKNRKTKKEWENLSMYAASCKNMSFFRRLLFYYFSFYF